jgi:hypothetical protein
VNRKDLTTEAARGIARVIALASSAIGLGITYWIWPEGIGELPLAETPLEKLLRGAGSVLVFLLTVAFAVRLWLDD